MIHHTPNTKASFLALLKHLAADGHIAIYTYKVKGPIREFCDDYIRERTVKMSDARVIPKAPIAATTSDVSPVGTMLS